MLVIDIEKNAEFRWIIVKKKRKRNCFFRFRTCGRATGYRLRFGETIDLSQLDTKLVLWMVAESKTTIDFGTRSWRAFSCCMPRQRRIIFCAMLLGLPFSIIIIFVWKYSFSHDKCLPASYYWSTENVTYSRSRAHLPRRFWSAASSFSMRNTSTVLAWVSRGLPIFSLAAYSSS